MSDVLTSLTARVHALRQAGDEGGWDVNAGRAALVALTDEGWLGVGVPEDLGGAGGELTDALDVVSAIASTGWPSPVADQLVVTGGVLAAAGVRVPPGLTVVIPDPGVLDSNGLHAPESALPWAPWADWFAVCHGSGEDSAVSLVAAKRAHLDRVGNLTQTPVAMVRIRGVVPDLTTPSQVPADELAPLGERLGRLARCTQSVAAMRSILELTVAHVRVRQQFGRPLSAFQAVQHHVAELAAELAAARAAVDVAVAGGGQESAVAAASVRVASAGTTVARLGHQLHGALGITREHALHRHSLALLEWQDDFGSPTRWARRLGASAARADDLWQWLVEEAT